MAYEQHGVYNRQFVCWQAVIASYQYAGYTVDDIQQWAFQRLLWWKYCVAGDTGKLLS